MSQANRRDPPSSAGIMSSTSVIGNFPVARDDDDDDDEEVNADDDRYNGNNSVGYDADGDDDPSSSYPCFCGNGKRLHGEACLSNSVSS